MDYNCAPHLGGLVLAVGLVHVGPRLAEQQHALPVPVPGRHVQRRQLLLVLGVHISTVRQQDPAHTGQWQTPDS